MGHPKFIMCVAECGRPAVETDHPPEHLCQDCGGKLCEWCCDDRKAGKLKLTLAQQLELPPKMMPGQEPYTPKEWGRVSKLVDQASRAGITEGSELQATLSCVTPNGRTDSHMAYVERRARDGKMVCAFCGKE